MGKVYMTLIVTKTIQRNEVRGHNLQGFGSMFGRVRFTLH